MSRYFWGGVILLVLMLLKNITHGDTLEENTENDTQPNEVEEEEEENDDSKDADHNSANTRRSDQKSKSIFEIMHTLGKKYSKLGKIPTAAVHGQYCGPGHGDPKFKAKPVDALDTICMEHLKCHSIYPKECSCDVKLYNDIQKLWREHTERNDSSLNGKFSMMADWFAVSPCRCTQPDGSRKEYTENTKLRVKKQCKHPSEINRVRDHGPGDKLEL